MGQNNSTPFYERSRSCSQANERRKKSLETPRAPSVYGCGVVYFSGFINRVKLSSDELEEFPVRGKGRDWNLNIFTCGRSRYDMLGPKTTDDRVDFARPPPQERPAFLTLSPREEIERKYWPVPENYCPDCEALRKAQEKAELQEIDRAPFVRHDADLRAQTTQEINFTEAVEQGRVSRVVMKQKIHEGCADGCVEISVGGGASFYMALSRRARLITFLNQKGFILVSPNDDWRSECVFSKSALPF